jgi:putative transposase
LVATKYDGSRTRSAPSRPPARDDKVRQLLLMARENPSWVRHIIPLGEPHLRSVIRDFVELYHLERNHQGLGNLIPFPAPAPVTAIGPVRRRERLGGLLAFYDRIAA